MAAIVQVESGGDPLAIGDNTTRRSYYPRDRATAERLARRLLDAGHLLDLGIAQIDSMNFAGFGVNVHTIFDPCINLSIGARILSDDYAFAARRYRRRSGRAAACNRHVQHRAPQRRSDATSPACSLPPKFEKRTLVAPSRFASTKRCALRS